MLNELTIKETHQGLEEKKFSCLELVRDCLEKIKKEDNPSINSGLSQVKSKGKKINAFITVCEKEALERAKEVDKKIAQKEKLKTLEGIPLAIKDNILIEGIKTTAASKILENYLAPYDATVIKKLKEEGAIFLGKTNLDEFAMGSSTENSFFGPTRNPYDLKRVAGGSSGGSAAAVASSMSLAALGSDTGGSIRQPASFCGVVGFKPSYGCVSRYGLIAMASSLDQIGPITKTVEDAKIVFEAIKGRDEMDATTIEIKNQKSKIKNKKPRIGIPKEYFIKGMDKEVEKLVKKAIKKIEKIAKIEEVSLPHTEYALACYYIIVFSEVSANLARYDGIRYGYSKIQNPKSKIQNLLDIYLKTRQEGFGDEAKRRIMLGTYSLSSGYYQAYYLKAQQVRALIKKDFDNVFKKVDFLITPVSPTAAFKIGEKIEDPLKMYLSDIFTISVNLAGLPAISIPCGFVKNLPTSFQVIGKQFEDEKVLEIARIYADLNADFRR